MVPLAVSGITVIGVVAVAAALLAWVLLHAETRDEEQEKAEQHGHD